MVIVKIEIWPLADESKAKTIGIATIVNDGMGDKNRGNYKVGLSHSGKYFGKKGAWKTGRFSNHRRQLSPYHLVLRALQATLGDRK